MNARSTLPTIAPLAAAPLAAALLAAALLAAACGEPGAPAGLADDGELLALPSATATTSGTTGAPPTVATPTVATPTAAAPAVVAAKRPPPITGGTMIALSDSALAISDPDRDQLYLVRFDAAGQSTLQTIAFEAGAQPTRLVASDDQRVHVVLRGSHQLATVDTTLATVEAVHAPCALPRGVTFSGEQGRLYVACAEGTVVALDRAGTELARQTELPRDLRDVVATPSGVQVSTFRTAQLLDLSTDLQLVQARSPNLAARGANAGAQTLKPSTAWRTKSVAGGRTLMVHQRAQETPLPSGVNIYYGSNCQTEIVQSSVTLFNATGAAVGSGGLSWASLPVDVTATPNGEWIAVASPGNYEAQNGGARSQLILVSQKTLTESAAAPSNTTGPCIGAAQVTNQFPGEVISVQFLSNAKLAVQVRQPAELRVFDLDVTAGSLSIAALVDLDARDVTDTGHTLFHSSPVGGVACASCHPEGGDDGHVWQFQLHGARRTQTLRGGVMQRAPFHWNAELADFSALMTEIMGNRMRAPVPPLDAQQALGSWLDSLPAESLPITDPAAVERGAALFASAEVGCAECHRGADLSSSELYDVGTNAEFLLKAATLRGIGLRSPLMHDGCALTMRDRFDPDCGGAQHGNVAQLSAAQLDDLIAFVSSL